MRARSTLVLALGVLLIGAGTVPAGAVDTEPLQAASVRVPPAGTVSLRTIPQAETWARHFARTGDVLWTEFGVIKAYDTSGALLGSVPDFALSPELNQARGLLASHDGSVLYAWSVADGIVAIDPATRQIVARMWPTVTPESVAPSPDGRALYYSYGSSGRIAILDLATGTSSPVLVAGRRAGLYTAGDILVVRTGDHLQSYRAARGTLTPLATRGLTTIEVSLAPDGSQLVAAVDGEDGDSVLRLSSADLGTLASVQLESSVGALTWAPGGGSYAIGLHSSTTQSGDVVQVRAAADDRMLSHSVWPGGGWPPTGGLDALTYGSNPSLLYGFGGDSTGRRFVTASTLPGFSAAASLKRVQPEVYGQRLRATFTAPGCAPCSVRFTLKDAVAGSREFTRTVNSTTDLSLAVKGNGTLTASIPASLRRRAVQRSVTYQVPLLMKIKMTGTYKKKNGVLVYSKRPSLRLAVGPARKVKVVETIQIRVNGRWKDTMARTLKTSSKGVLTARSREPRDSSAIRLKYTFYPDGKNAEAAAVSPKLRWR